MSGLVLKLAPSERFLVNGALLENGDKPTRIRISDNDARILRCSDALKPEQVDTPVKQVYFAIQLLITGDLDAETTLNPILRECAKLEDVFQTVDPKTIPSLIKMIERGNFYSALCHLRGVIELEQKIMDVQKSKESQAA